MVGVTRAEPAAALPAGDAARGEGIRQFVVPADQAQKMLLSVRRDVAVEIFGGSDTDNIQQHEIAGRDVYKYLAHRACSRVGPPAVLIGGQGLGHGYDLAYDDFEFP